MQKKVKDIVKKLLSNTPLRKKQSFLATQLKPFTLQDLQPVPADWQINGPDFVGVAAGKSGTSWWYSLLLKHPQVVQNRCGNKELHYFDHFTYRGMSQEEQNIYLQAFAAPQNTICGEWSPNYLTHPFCIEYLAQTTPHTKILLLLRNPIDRMISQINFQAYSRINSFNFTANEKYIYELYTIYLNSCIHSYYSIGLRQLLRFFDRSQILVLQYEKCKLDPAQEIKKTYHFLGIDDQYSPPNLTRVVNKTNYSLPDLKTDERYRLAKFLSEEMRITKEMFPEIDLSLWIDP